MNFTETEVQSLVGYTGGARALLLGLGIWGKVLPLMVVGLGVMVLPLSAKILYEEYGNEL